MHKIVLNVSGCCVLEWFWWNILIRYECAVGDLLGFLMRVNEESGCPFSSITSKVFIIPCFIEGVRVQAIIRWSMMCPSDFSFGDSYYPVVIMVLSLVWALIGLCDHHMLLYLFSGYQCQVFRAVSMLCIYDSWARNPLVSV